MTVFDYVFFGVLGVSAAVGLWRGLVSEVIALLAWVVAVAAAWRFSGAAAEVLTGVVAEPMWRHVGGFVLIFVSVLLVAALLRFLLKELLRAVGLGAVDRLFGALFGLARGLAIVFALVLFGGLAGIAQEPWWSNALFSTPLETAVIAAKPWLPEAVAHRIRFR